MQLPPSDEDYRRAGAALLGHQTAPAQGDATDMAVADDPTADAASRPRIVNVPLAASLLDNAALVVHVDGRDHAYRVRAMPFVQSAELYHFEAVLDQEWARLRSLADRNPHTNDEARAILSALVLIYAEVAAIMWSVVEPASALARWRWRLFGRPKANPFHRLEFTDMQRALGFFSRARTSTRLSWVGSVRAPRSLTWTWAGTSSPTGPSGSAPAALMATP